MDNTMQPNIAGKVITNDGQERIAGIKVTLRGLENRSAKETITDFLGAFEFSGLSVGVTYIIKAQLSDFITDEVTLKFNKSLDLGNLVLRQG